MTKFVWKNGTELNPVPLTANQATKLAGVINNSNIAIKDISGVVCLIEDISDSIRCTLESCLTIVKSYEEETASINLSSTFPNSGFIITSDEAELGDFLCPTGVTCSYGTVTITSGYTPSTNKLDLIQFRLGIGNNFPSCGVPINLSTLNIPATVINNFKANPTIGHKFITYPALNEIFIRHTDLCDFIEKIDESELIQLFIDTEDEIKDYANEGSFDLLKTYIKSHPDCVKYLNENPAYANSLVETGWKNWTIVNGNAVINNNVPIKGVETFTLPTWFRGNSSTASSVTELVDKSSGWVLDRNIIISTNLEKVTICCISISNVALFNNYTALKELHLPNCVSISNTNTLTAPGFLQNATNVEVVDFPALESLRLDGGDGSSCGFWNIKGTETVTFPKLNSAYKSGNAYLIQGWTVTKYLNFPELTTIPTISNATWMGNMPVLEELYMPKVITIGSVAGWPTLLAVCPELRRVRLAFTGFFNKFTSSSSGVDNSTFSSCPKLIDIEWLCDREADLSLHAWNPSTVLASEEDTATMNENIRNHIVPHLKLYTSGTHKFCLCQTMVDAMEGTTIAAITARGWTLTTYS